MSLTYDAIVDIMLDMRDKIEACIRLLKDVLDELDGIEPALPEIAKKLLEKNVCLNCKKPIGKSREIRGCHEGCARRTNNEIALGRITEREAIEAGILAPRAQAGRKRTDDSLSRLIAEKAADPIGENVLTKPPQKRKSFADRAAEIAAEGAREIEEAVKRHASAKAKPPVKKFKSGGR